MAVSPSLELTNNAVDTVYIDADSVNSAKNKVKADLTNIIKDIDNIKNGYQKLLNDSKTKGSYKDVAQSCVKACKKYHNNLNTVKTSLENKIDAAVMDYVLSMLSELKTAQAAADTINTNAE